LERHERLAERRTPVDAVPRREEARERLLLDRLDLPPQRRERRAPQPPQDIRIAPLALGAAGAELAADEQLVALELPQQRLDVAAEALVRRVGRERAAALRVAQDELAERVGAALEERVRKPGRRHRAERVAVASRVLGG